MKCLKQHLIHINCIYISYYYCVYIFTMLRQFFLLSFPIHSQQEMVFKNNLRGQTVRGYVTNALKGSFSLIQPLQEITGIVHKDLYTRPFIKLFIIPHCLGSIKYGMCIKWKILHVLKIKFSWGDYTKISGCQGLEGGRDEQAEHR